MQKRFVGFYNYSVILTILGLLFTVWGMTQCLHGHYKIAVGCLIMSGVCDAFDGIVARTRKKATEDERAYGIQLDSLADMVCFGIYPAFLCYMLGTRGFIGMVCICFYVVCGFTRLAYFNVLEAKRQETAEVGTCAKRYHGLPITAIVSIFPLVFSLQYLAGSFAMWIGLHVMLIVVGFLFILDWPMPKPTFKVIVVGIIILIAYIIFILKYTHFQVPPPNVYISPFDPVIVQNLGKISG